MKFKQALKENIATGTGDIQGLQVGYGGRKEYINKPKKKKKKQKMIKRFSLRKSNMLKRIVGES